MSHLDAGAVASPRVSLIVPVFDKSAHLAECLESLLDQSLADIEIICIDDASTDTSLEILEAYAASDSRIRLIRNDSNAGAARSRNAGLDLATGAYLRFVDADDIVPQDSTKTLYDRAILTAADLVRGSIALFRGERSSLVSTARVGDRWTTTFATSPDLWIPWWHTTYLISAGLLREHGIRYPDLRRGEDPVFIASVLAAARTISTIPDIVYLYRKYSKTTGSAATGFDEVEDTLRHARIIKSLYLARHAAAWHEGYGPYLLEDFVEFIGRCELSDDQRQRVSLSVDEIWPGNSSALWPDPGD